MFSVAVLLLVLVAAIGSGVMSVFMFSVFSRLRRLESGSGEQAGEIAAGGLEQLSEEIALIRTQIEQLEQRTEFNERLLENRSADE